MQNIAPAVGPRGSLFLVAAISFFSFIPLTDSYTPSIQYVDLTVTPTTLAVNLGGQMQN